MAQICNDVHIKQTEEQQYSSKVLAAAEEARLISRDPQVPGYTDMEALKKALEE